MIGRSTTLAFTVAIAASGLAQTTLQATLQKHYDAYSHAVSAKDTKFVEGYFTPGYTVTLPTHEVKTRDDVLKAINDLYGKGSKLKWTFKVGELHIVGDGVMAMVPSHLSARMVGDDKKKHQVEIDGVNQDIWSQVGTDWVLKRTEIVSLKLKVDGKSVEPPPGVFPSINPKP